MAGWHKGCGACQGLKGKESACHHLRTLQAGSSGRVRGLHDQQPPPPPSRATAPTGKKLEAVEHQVSSSGRMGRFAGGQAVKKGELTNLPRIARTIRSYAPLCWSSGSLAACLGVPAIHLPDCLPPTLAACPAEDGKLEQVVRDTARVAAEQIKGLSTQVGAAYAWCNKRLASKSCVSSH